jgi:O-antigen/teichoic acid export membrane protein
MNSRSPILDLKTLANRFSIGAATAFSMQVLGAALSFLFSLLLAKLIGAAGLGLYFLCITTVEICSTISRLGFDNAALKFISIAHASGDRNAMAALYRKSIGIAALAAAVTALPVWLFLGLTPLGGNSHAEFVALIPVLLFALIPATILTIQSESFKAVGHPGTAVFVQIVVPQTILLTSGVMLAWRDQATVGHVLACYAAALCCAAGLALVRWAPVVENIWRKGNFSSALLFRTSFPILMVTSLNLVMAWTDIVVLGIWSDTVQVGIYGVALRIASTTGLVVVAVNSVVAPEFAVLHSRGRRPELARVAQRAAFWTLALAAPLILIFLVFPLEILGLFGQQFLPGAWPLRLFAIAQLINVATGQVASLLIMTGHEKWMRNNIAASAAFNLAGNLILVPFLGALGAAISTVFCIALLNLIAWWLVRRKLHINTMAYLNPRKFARLMRK